MNIQDWTGSQIDHGCNNNWAVSLYHVKDDVFLVDMEGFFQLANAVDLDWRDESLESADDRIYPIEDFDPCDSFDLVKQAIAKMEIA